MTAIREHNLINLVFTSEQSNIESHSQSSETISSITTNIISSDPLVKLHIEPLNDSLNPIRLSIIPYISDSKKASSQRESHEQSHIFNESKRSPLSSSSSQPSEVTATISKNASSTANAIHVIAIFKDSPTDKKKEAIDRLKKFEADFKKKGIIPTDVAFELLEQRFKEIFKSIKDNNRYKYVNELETMQIFNEESDIRARLADLKKLIPVEPIIRRQTPPLHRNTNSRRANCIACVAVTLGLAGVATLLKYYFTNWK